MSGDFVLRCSCCGSYYAVPRTGGLRQVDYLPRGPRCIQDRNGQACGAPLTRGSLRRGAQLVAAGDLLGWTVTRPAPAAADSAEVARLRAEVARLRERYETPCPGLVSRFGQGVARCGGFLGHPGECAEVW